jgi:hypothetical protein
MECCFLTGVLAEGRSYYGIGSVFLSRRHIKNPDSERKKVQGTPPFSAVESRRLISTE